MSGKSLRISVDARPLSLPMSGITRYTRELLTRLLKDSPHQWFLYLNRPPLYALPDLPNVTIRHGNVRSKTLGQLHMQTVFPYWSRKDRTDVFWSPRHHLPLMLSRHVKNLLTIHDLVWLRYPETMTTQGKWVELMLMPASLKQADRIITVSRATQADLASEFPLYASKIMTVYPGLTHTPVEMQQELCQLPYFLFVGTLEPRKNLRTLLKAFAQVVEKEPGCRLLIIGAKGWGKEDLHTEISKLGIEADVIMAGPQNDAGLAALYADATALVMPSLYEGFGLPLVEAMGQGTPVITSAYGAMEEVAGEAGILVSPKSEKSIGNAMLQMLDSETREHYSRKAIKRAAQFNWDESAEQILAQIEALGRSPG